MKKWKTYQEYLDFKYEENFKITNSHTPKDIQSQQHNLKIARVMYIFLAPFIIFLLLRQISGMIENINYIDIQDNSTAIVYYHFTPNKIILKNEISHFGIKNKSKEIRKSNSSGTRTHYYCEISIILKNGEHKTFDVYSLDGSFQYCRTKKFTIQYN